MPNLKDILDKVRSETLVVESFENDEPTGSEEEYEYEGPMCYYLNEDGTCSDGCSCADIEIEQECPFVQSGDFESCCCYEEAASDEEYSDDEEYEEDSERNFDEE